MCKQKLSYKHSTNNLKKPITRKTLLVHMDIDDPGNPNKFEETFRSNVREKIGEGNTSCALNMFQPQASTSGVVMKPRQLVQSNMLRFRVKALNPAYNLPDHHTISKSLIPSMYEKCLAHVHVANVYYVCITTDCWTSPNNESYIDVTCNFIEDDFTQGTVMLECCVFHGRHKSENLADELNSVIVEWAPKTK
ncbi:hypothetical protein PR048_016433 [Dryococelus australis]|uniref:Uncharacterized protein n=1 Tax=Dryococelus australis TaxID=614101 RepID=A0ABQ9HJQ8_9NEOP|nr:hypothetical protein PR048_016433 [Dryococelus australis]